MMCMYPFLISSSHLSAHSQLRVSAYPTLNFTVIVNPNSEPGSSQYPNSDYISQIQKLNSYPNVRTVGYVRTGYSSRNVTDVISDVATYSGWSSQSATVVAKKSIFMHGIFFDEVPSAYTTDVASYLQTINQSVKNATGLQEKLVILSRSRKFHTC